jgi:4-hydroxy-tetrahydrodipicolinate synthase
MKRSNWPKGLVTALITPMTSDGIDTEGVKQLIAHQIKAGVSGVVVAGGTGEHGALSFEERKQFARVVADATHGRLPFIVQSGALATRDAIKLSQDAQEIGAAGILLPAPYGESVNWREKVAFYTDVNDAVKIPIMLYNTSTAGIMGIKEIEQLAKLSNISAVKHSHGDGTLLGDILAWSHTNDFAVYTGWDDLTLPAIMAGAHGALLGAGNVVPELIVKVLRLSETRQLTPELEKSWGRLRRFLRFIGDSENYVSVVKLGTQLRGVQVGEVRRPYLMPQAAERAALIELLDGLKDELGSVDASNVRATASSSKRP